MLNTTDLEVEKKCRWGNSWKFFFIFFDWNSIIVSFCTLYALLLFLAARKLCWFFQGCWSGRKDFYDNFSDRKYWSLMGWKAAEVFLIQIFITTKPNSSNEFTILRIFHFAPSTKIIFQPTLSVSFSPFFTHVLQTLKSQNLVYFH